MYGDFWHGYRFPAWSRKLSEFWQDKIEKNRTRDQRNFRTKVQNVSSGSSPRSYGLTDSTPQLSWQGREQNSNGYSWGRLSSGELPGE
jgi:hypothetical protein